MKFKIREGYAVILPAVREKSARGEWRVKALEARHVGGQVIDLTAEQALDHLAKLEPADKESATFLASQVRRIPQVTA